MCYYACSEVVTNCYWSLSTSGPLTYIGTRYQLDPVHTLSERYQSIQRCRQGLTNRKGMFYLFLGNSGCSELVIIIIRVRYELQGGKTVKPGDGGGCPSGVGSDGGVGGVGGAGAGAGAGAVGGENNKRVTLLQT